MSHFSVNAVRPITSYILGVLVLCIFGWSMSQGIVVLPFEGTIPFHKEVAMGLFALAALFGVGTLLKNIKRSEKPWAVSRAQVNRYYTLFLITTCIAIVVAK